MDWQGWLTGSLPGVATLNKVIFLPFTVGSSNWFTEGEWASLAC